MSFVKRIKSLLETISMNKLQLRVSKNLLVLKIIQRAKKNWINCDHDECKKNEVEVNNLELNLNPLTLRLYWYSKRVTNKVHYPIKKKKKKKKTVVDLNNYSSNLDQIVVAISKNFIKMIVVTAFVYLLTNILKTTLLPRNRKEISRHFPYIFNCSWQK